MRQEFKPQIVGSAPDDSRVVRAIARDIRSGKIDGRVTYPMVKTAYGLRVDKRIRRVFVALDELGLIRRIGRSYYVVPSAERAAA